MSESATTPTSAAATAAASPPSPAAAPTTTAAVHATLVDYILDRIKLPGFDRSVHVTDESRSTIAAFVSSSTSIKLLAFFDPALGLCINQFRQAQSKKIARLAFFVKLTESALDAATIASSLHYGSIDGSLLDSLLRHMTGVYLPAFLASRQWPDSVKKDLSGQLNKFMATLTESANQARGHTVLYLPAIDQFESSDTAASKRASEDKDLVQRLESTVIHWTRQIKEVVSNVDYAAGSDASGPLDEIEFWRSRTLDLSSIKEQLERPGVRTIVDVLKLANSSYLKPFNHLTLLIGQGSEEAQNNLLFLSKLAAPCSQLAEAEPAQIPALLPAIASMIRLIWSHSQFYTTEERLTGLLRKVSNQLINQCSRAIQLTEIFDGDVLGSMVLLQQSVNCAQAWHEVYEQTCRLIDRDNKCLRKWKFDPASHGIFAQLDAFAQRCHNLREVCEGQLQFARKNIVAMTTKPCTGDKPVDGESNDSQTADIPCKENSTDAAAPARIQHRAVLPAFGGPKGAEIEKSLAEIEQTFLGAIHALASVDYDILNVKATNWHHDYNAFKNTLKDLEVMLANVLSSSWECVASVSQGVELIEHFAQLAVRPAIKTAVDRKVVDVCAMFAGDVKKVKAEFDKYKKDPPLLAGQPRFAGAALWAKSLLARVEHDYFALANAAYVTNAQQQEECKKHYTAYESVIEAYVRHQHAEWVETVQLSNTGQRHSTLTQRLERPLMIRADTKEDQSLAQQQVASMLKQSTSSMGLRVAKSGHLEVNFDHHLLKLFNEVRYWDKFHGIYPIPYVAYEMYQHQDSLRIVREAVMLVVRDYNTIVDALPVDEKRLFSEHLRRVDRKISPGLAKLTWNEKHIKDWFVKVCREQCGAVYDIVTAFKANHEAILSICHSISECLLVDIETNVVYDDATFEQRQRTHAVKIGVQLTEAHDHIVQIVKDSYAFFADHGPEIQAEWKKYVKKTDTKVEEALRQMVKHSLQELSKAINGDSKTEAHPLFRVNMVLDEGKGKVEFRPSVAELSQLIKHVSRDSITTIQTVPRLTDTLGLSHSPQPQHSQVEEKQQLTLATTALPVHGSSLAPSFYDVISNDDEILKLLVHIMHGTTNLSVELSKLITHYDRYAPIWNTDKAAFIRRYANTKRPLSSFDMDITRYRNNQSDIASEDAHHSVGFIKVDCSLLKAALVQHCVQWQAKLTHLLHHNASTELNTLHQYFSENTALLTQVPQTLDKLSESLALLTKTQSDLVTFQARFGPCEDMYKCLDKFDFAPSEEEKELVDSLKQHGTDYLAVVQQAAAMLEARSIEMRRELEEQIHSFNKHLSDLKNEFKEQAPFAAVEEKGGSSGGGSDAQNESEASMKDEDLMPDVISALAILSAYKAKFAEHRVKAQSMEKGIALFQFRALDLSELDECDRELGDLERVWSVIKEWEDKWRRWRATLFIELNIEDIDAHAANYLKSLAKMNKSIKSWRIHRTIVNLMQRFRATLPLIADLRSPAMRARHWDTIMDEITHRFDIHAPTFTLDSMYALNLQAHAELINGIAATAQRELNVEQQLREMSELWFTVEFHYADYKSRYLIVAEVDEINDHLERHQLTLSTMKNSPYYATFTPEINYFSMLCNELSECIELLMTVQKQWRYLESIFVDGADIKRQLPSESAWFDAIHAEFMRILRKLCGADRCAANGRNYNGYKPPAMHTRFGGYGANEDNDDDASSDFLPPSTESTGVFKLRSFESFRHTLDVATMPASTPMKVDVRGKVLSLLESRSLPRLTRMTELLDLINHSLDAYLEAKRQLFPRFYFLSNDDLLSILGQSREPLDVNHHARKLFPGIAKFDFKLSGEANQWEVMGVYTVDGEYQKLLQPVIVDGEMESWLSQLDAAIQLACQKALYMSLSQVGKVVSKKSALENWVRTSPGHLMLLSGQIGWTAKVAQAINDLHKNRRAIKKLKSEWHDYLNKLAKYVRSNSSSTAGDGGQSVDEIERAKLTSLITVEIHARDVIDKLKQTLKVKDKLSLQTFEWQAQLRFYFEKAHGEFGQAVIKQNNAHFHYGYELVEFSGRLVLTPLTDRCYMTLTTALNLARGGSPLGPAGTGKTETVKDLSKNLGRACVVYNCSNAMNVESLNRNLSGLAQTGAWGCFDEFNRISIEVLSVIALSAAALFDAIRTKATNVVFDGASVKLNHNVGVFITMNPGYAGRTELPDNLQSLFRPVAMIAPDSAMIAEVLLQSAGFKESGALARKLITVYELMEQQLSKQSHYSYGLRALKAALLRAASIMRAVSSQSASESEWTEEMIVMRALKDCNRSKLVEEDRVLFDLMIADVFPNLELPALEEQALRMEVTRQCQIAGLTVSDSFIDKIVQLYETKLTRHGVALVGATMTGKSAAWKTLAAALTALADAKVSGYRAVECYTLNPKSISTAEMFGRFTADGEWRDGILSSLMRRACTSETSTEKWLIIDGPVDTLWIESLNTVLDDTKVLTLINGDRINLPPTVRLIFEVEDLRVASPATVSRLGMVHFDDSTLTVKAIIEAWCSRKQTSIEAAKSASPDTMQPQPVFMNKEGVEFLGKLFDKYALPALTLRRTNPEVHDLLPMSDTHAIISLCQLFDSIATPANGVDCAADEANYMRMIELWFTFCTVWSVGATLDDPGRAKLDVFIRDVEAQFPPLQTVYEYVVDGSKKDWALWEEHVNNAWRPSPITPFHRILVPTIDTVRHSFIINHLMAAKVPVLIVGQTGTGKSAQIAAIMDAIDPASTLCYTLNLSANITAEQTQSSIESRLEKRQRNNYGPTGARSKLLVFLDDLNLPLCNEFGSQEVHELLRQFLDYGAWYDRSKQQRQTIQDVQIIAAMAYPGGARAPLSQRFQSKFSLVHFTVPAEAQVKRIFRTLLVNHFSEFDEPIKPLGLSLTQATLDIYRQAGNEFLPTPATPHYTINLRDLSAVVRGLMQSQSRHFDSRESVLRLWIHECSRIFGDRLCSHEERDKLLEMLNQKLQANFDSSWKKLLKDPKQLPIFTECMDEEFTANSIVNAKASENDESEERRPYVEVTQKLPKLKAHLAEALEVFNNEHSKTYSAIDLVLFESAVDHLLRIHRVLSLPRGSLLLIGVGGIGRSSLVRLAAHMARMECRELKVTVGYRMADFKSEIKDIYLLTGLKQRHCVLIVKDSQLVHREMMDDINSILTSGEIHQLFPPEELSPMLDELRLDAVRLNKSTTAESLYTMFIERVRSHLHLALCFSPVGQQLRTRIRTYPALIHACTIDYFNAWNNGALQEVAARMLQSIDLNVAQQAVGPTENSTNSSSGGHPSSAVSQTKASVASSAGLVATNNKLKESLASFFTSIHSSSVEVSGKMRLEIKRENWITATRYLDLVRSFRHLFETKRASIVAQADKLRAGLTKLESSGEQVRLMTIQLEDKKKVVAQKKLTCDKLLVEIVQKQRAADEQKKQVELDAARTEVEARDCESIRSEAQEELDKVLPALDKAIKALEKLSKSAVTEVKSYQKPPKPVEKVMCAVMTVMDKEPSWSTAKKELNDPNFLHKLKEFDKDKISNNTLKAIQKYTKNHEFNPDDIGNVSQAAGALCEWVIAMEMYAKVFRDVEPRRHALAKAEQSLQQKQEELTSAESQLNEVRLKVAKLEETFSASELEQNTLRKEAETLELKLKSAAKLVEGLSSEKTRWEASIKAYHVDLKNLMGDCALASAFLSYSGPFPAAYRDTLLKKHWTPAIRKLNMPHSASFSAVQFLASEYEAMQWQIQGLPSDAFSLENGALVASGFNHHWPLLIDPQQQGKQWIKKREAKNSLQIVDLSMTSPRRALLVENALSKGLPLLIEDCGEELDSSLDNILALDPCQLADSTTTGALKPSSVMIGTKEIALDPRFRLYLTTKLSNPHYKPEVGIHTAIINFSVVEKGLENQLLGIVVRMEEPALEKEKQSLVSTVNDNKRKLIELEDEILSLLQSSTASVIDDEPLITALTQSKQISESVKEKLSSAVVTEAKIDSVREQYRACALRATHCFFVLNELSQIDPMYQFALNKYIQLFENSIVASREGDTWLSATVSKNNSGMGGGGGGGGIDLIDRINSLNDHHTLATFHYGCRALFDKHKLLFSFQLCLAKLRSDEKMDKEEFEFFLRGAQLFERSSRPTNPCSEWLSEVSWDNVCELNKLPSFSGLIQSFESAGSEWKAWYRSEAPTPEKMLSPFDWNQNSSSSSTNKSEKRDLGAFQHLLLVRCLRPDRVVFAARQFIAANLGPLFMEIPTIDLTEIYPQLTPATPCIFILSQGMDPTESIRALAQSQRAQLEVLALGQGQSTIAQSMLEKAIKHGHWLYLANLHLSLDWLPELDKLVDSLTRTSPAPHTAFRLYLSSKPHAQFPVSLLQASVKLTTEPARGLRANMLRLLGQMSESSFNATSRPDRYRRAVFALAWFHSILVERRKFNSLGFTQSYHFNDGDFAVCENLLSLYIEEHDETPWEALRFLIAECNYGGRVTDQQDRKLLQVYAQQLFNDNLINAPRFPLSSLETYYVPDECATLESTRAFVSSWPSASEDAPEAFGQHPNADIASQMDETKTLLSSILALQPRQLVEGTRSREEIVLEVIKSLTEQIPQPFDKQLVHSKYDKTERSPLTVVLLQELDRYTELLSVIHLSLHELDRGIRGLAVISNELEAMFDALYHSRVPVLWQHYPSLKPLGSWSRDLIARVQQLKRWHEEETLKVFWLGGLMRPAALLTALLQTTARKQRVSIESLAFDFVVLSTPESGIAARPKDGAYIKGLYLEGARFDTETQALSDATPMELFSALPIIHFKPIEARRKAAKSHHALPVYVYPVRSATTSGQQSYVSDVELKAGARDSSTWTKRGAAIVLALDD